MRECDEAIWHRYESKMTGENLSPATVNGYWQAVRSLSGSLPDGRDLYEADADDITAWLSSGRSGALRDESGNPIPEWADSTMATYARRVRTFYTFLEKRGLVDEHPMRTLGTIRETETEIPIPDAEDVVTLIKSIKASGQAPWPRGAGPKLIAELRFRSRRDLAMIGILCEPGTPRATELATLGAATVDMRHDRITVMGKGRRERTIPFGEITATAITLYLRMRKEHKHAGRPELFLGRKGPLTRWGVRNIIADRCAEAGIKAIKPHAFRHLTAHEWFAAGGSEGDAMSLFGWRSSAMTRRYARSAAAERAREHARSMSIGDKLLGPAA
jgi:site-specific recombinase XerD